MPFISKAQELRKLNVALHGQMCALIKKAEDEKRALSTEESTSWDRMDAEFEARKVEIEKHEKTEKRELELASLDPRRAGRDGDPELRGDGLHTPAEIAKRDKPVFVKALRSFLGGLPPEQNEEDVRAFLKKSRDATPPEIRALGLTGSAGGFTIPQNFMPELDVALLAYSGIAQAARFVDTTDGADLPWPSANDTTAAGHILAEGSAAATNVDPAFGSTTLKAYVYTSDIVLLANQLIQDSAFNIDQEVANLCGIRLGRILNTHGTTGTGTSQPKGIITASVSGFTAASATAIAYADLVELQHSIDPAYRVQGCSWMFHDNILKALKKLVDTTGRPLWLPGVAVKEPDTLIGFPYFINQAMASAITTGQKTVLFGQMKKYIIRRAMGLTLVVLRERYAEFFQTGVVMFARWDSNLIDAGTHPTKFLTQA